MDARVRADFGLRGVVRRAGIESIAVESPVAPGMARVQHVSQEHEPALFELLLTHLLRSKLGPCELPTPAEHLPRMQHLGLVEGPRPPSPELATLLDDPSWHPRLDFGTGRLRLSAMPDMEALRRPQQHARPHHDHWLIDPDPWQAWADARRGRAPAPQLVFMVNYCCSNLLCEALDALPQVLCMREPQTLYAFAMAERRRRQGLPTLEPERDDPRRGLALLSRLPEGIRTFVIKEQAAVSALLQPVLRASPGSRGLFLYAGLDAFVAAVVGLPNRMKMVRDILRECDEVWTLPWLAGVSLDDLSDGRTAAVHWLAQRHHMEQAATSDIAPRLRSLHADELLLQPERVLSALSWHFGIDATVEDCARVAASPVFMRHAKRPDEPFDAQARRRVLAQALEAHREAVDDALGFARERAPFDIDARWPLPLLG